MPEENKKPEIIKKISTPKKPPEKVVTVDDSNDFKRSKKW